jgi:hypothetical protein
VSTPTTRRHPRSLAEAFPKEHANPVHFYPSPRFNWRAAVCVAGCCLIGWLAYRSI